MKICYIGAQNGQTHISKKVNHIIRLMVLGTMMRLSCTIVKFNKIPSYLLNNKTRMGVLTSLCSDQVQRNKNGQSSHLPMLKSSRALTAGSKSQAYDSTVMSSTLSVPTAFHSRSAEMNPCSALSINPQGEDHFGQKLSMKFCDFEILGELGSGNFGTVYQVALKNQQGQRSQVYALKKLSRKSFGNTRTIQNIRLQRQILISIKHQFLTQLKYSFADQDYIYFVMECAAGGSAQSLLSLKKIQGSKKNQRAIKFRELGQSGVRFITACAVLGLEELHRHNILYRDLKPENVLIFADGYVKLADFGLAKVLEKAQQTKTEAGTVSYLAPEVIAKQGYNKLIDFWALGVFIYELATSESPFRHDQILTRPTFKSKVEQAERNRDWKDFQLSLELKDLINQLLRCNPQQRLGAGGFEQIKSHCFFKEVDWQALLKKETPSPLLPILAACPFKISQIKGKSVIKKTLSFNLDLENEWMYDFKMEKTQSSG